MRALLLGLGLLALAPGCSNDPGTTDAGRDATTDVGVDGAVDDAFVCDMACPAGRSCCIGGDGAPHCVDLANDITNCGVCNRDCVATRRGDSCMNNQCGCGDFEIGCTGAENSICCPSVAGIRPYCANPGLDLSDCGGCGHACNPDQANQCSGGMCLCGDTGGHCTGTNDDVCCSDPAGAFSCVDTRSDQSHCGSCGNRCTAFQHCVSSVCVTVTIGDAGADAP
jgi:hypothetical protein